MLQENGRLIRPKDIISQVNWDEMDFVVVIAQPKFKEKISKPDENHAQLWMSTLTVQELAFVATQLQAHVTCICGPMREMPDNG